MWIKTSQKVFSTSCSVEYAPRLWIVLEFPVRVRVESESQHLFDSGSWFEAGCGEAFYLLQVSESWSFPTYVTGGSPMYIRETRPRYFVIFLFKMFENIFSFDWCSNSLKISIPLKNYQSFFKILQLLPNFWTGFRPPYWILLAQFVRILIEENKNKSYWILLWT